MNTDITAQPPPPPPTVPALSSTGRYLILLAGCLGWLCAGMHMAITQLTGQAAATDLLARSGAFDLAQFEGLNKRLPPKGKPPSPGQELSTTERAQLDGWKAQVARWFAWYQCAFLFGAAAGGLCFGWLGDRIGRATGMAVSILTYSSMAAACTLAQSPPQLLLLWFLACMGVGGMWPNGVALVSEAWSNLSRPMVAGLIGTSANIGIFFLSSLATKVPITPHGWHWVMLVGAAPVVLGLFALVAVPESPRWLAAQKEQSTGVVRPVSTWEIFRPPLLQITLVGILLATVPLIGGWGSANWMVPWAGEAGERADPPDPYLKAQVQQARALTGIVGSFLGGWIAAAVGRRRSFFLVSLFSLLIAQFTFWFAYPTDKNFLILVAALGFFSGIYFGWLPLFLPELFPTRVRSTGAGVSFNFGRIVTAVTIFIAGALMEFFAGNYAFIGRVTSLIFVLGMVGICFAPDTSRKQLAD